MFGKYVEPTTQPCGRPTTTNELFETSWCQPPSHLPVIVQRSGITPAIVRNSQGQPPNYLSAISQRSKMTPEIIRTS